MMAHPNRKMMFAMAIIIKTAPIEACLDDIVSVNEVTMYGGENVEIGDAAFLYFSETQGGGGSHGTVELKALRGWRHVT